MSSMSYATQSSSSTEMIFDSEQRSCSRGFAAASRAADVVLHAAHHRCTSSLLFACVDHAPSSQ